MPVLSGRFVGHRLFLPFMLFVGSPLAGQTTSTRPAPIGLFDQAGQGSLNEECAAALKSHHFLLIASTLHVRGKATISCDLWFAPDARIVADSEARITIAGAVNASPRQQIFDVSASNASLGFARGAVLTDYPQWFGATGDGAHDDTAAIQAAIDACRGLNEGAPWFVATCSVTLPNTGRDAYRTTRELRLYSSQPKGAYSGMSVCGEGKYSATLDFEGASDQSAIHMIGLDQELCNLRIRNRSATGWLDAVTYDGIKDVGISTGGKIDSLFIECAGHPGNGITTGRNKFQADQLEIRHSMVLGCTSGIGIATMDPNSLSIHLFAVTLSHDWIGVETNPSTTVAIYGGEFDDNDLNFQPGSGSTLTISGVRSEGSKRTIVTGVGAFPQSVTFEGYALSSDYASEHKTPRSDATGVCEKGGSRLTISADSVTWGDYIIVSGAGPGGGDLRTHIASMRSPTEAVLDEAPCASSVSGARVSFDESAQQNAFEEHGGGPYLHLGGYVNLPRYGTFSRAIGPQIWQGMGWRQDLTNPFGVKTTLCPESGVSWSGLYASGSPLKGLLDYSSSDLHLSRSMQSARTAPGDAVPTRGPLWCASTSAPGAK